MPDDARQAGNEVVIEAMTDFFWEWRADNLDAVTLREGMPDIVSLYRGLSEISVGCSLRIGEST